MLRGMSSRQFGEWMAFGRIEPFGESIADIRAGTIAAILVGSKRGRRGKSPSDFFPWLARDLAYEKESDKPANPVALWSATCAALGLTDKAGRMPQMIPSKRKS